MPLYGYCARYQVRSAAILLALSLQSNAVDEEFSIFTTSIHFSKLRESCESDY